jgi:hypothetical protein
MIKLLALAVLATAAFAAPASAENPGTYAGYVDVRPLMAPEAPSAEALANHKLYVANLKAAGFTDTTVPYAGYVDTRPLMAPDHSKVGKTAHYKGAPANPRDPSAAY